MMEIIKQTLARIPDETPKPFVLGILFWICVAALMPLAVLFIYLKWRTVYLALFWIMFSLVVCFGLCVLWFLVEVFTGRRTTWR